jgi:DNA-binding XRE family transcriptional regulator
MALPPPELEPLYTEVEAARLLGLKPRSLRSERTNGRISYKPVAGRIMYRASDLVRWQRQGERRCPKEDPAKSQSLSSAAIKAGLSNSTTKPPPLPDASERALAIADRLIASSRIGRRKTEPSSTPTHPPAPVIPLTSRSVKPLGLYAEGHSNEVAARRTGSTPSTADARAFNEALQRRLRRLRERANLTQVEVAKALGMPSRCYQHFEARSPLPAYLIRAFAEVVGCSIADVLIDPPTD